MTQPLRWLFALLIFSLWMHGTQSAIDTSTVRAQLFRELISRKGVYDTFPPGPPPPRGDDSGQPLQPPLKVGIIGAGAAGLYSALILQSLGVKFEVLEADGRAGGRIYTHYFDPVAWEQSTPEDPAYYNYYDVGAMRIPVMPYMDRVIGPQNWSAVNYVNSHVSDPADVIDLIPYIFSANNTFQLFNDVLVKGDVIPSAATFRVLTTEGGDIPPSDFAVRSPDAIYSDAISELIDSLEQSFTAGFDKLMEFDQLSVRAYLLQKGFTNAQINWLETIEEGTLSFDKASLAQAVVEQWIFTAAPPDSWVAINGGSERLINGIVKVLQTKPKLRHRVTAIKPGQSNSLTVVVNYTSEHSYSHVINTIPLGATRLLDTSKLPDIFYNTTMAWRALAYDDAGKIGLWFKTRWWEDPNVLSAPIVGGQSSTDLPIRRCVYPSYGLDVHGAPGAMIASYTWSQDAARLAAFYQSEEQREFITQAVLEDMARLHNISIEFIQDQLIDVHLWDWYDHPYSDGAYALFGPAQFSDVLPPLMRPSSNGRLHTAGEAASSGHAWIVGALNSAYRAVMEVFAVEGRRDLMEEMVKVWGTVDEVDMGWFESPNP